MKENSIGISLFLFKHLLCNKNQLARPPVSFRQARKMKTKGF